MEADKMILIYTSCNGIICIFALNLKFYIKYNLR